MSDLIERLRCWVPPDPGFSATAKLLDEAANRIEKLERALRECKTEFAAYGLYSNAADCEKALSKAPDTGSKE